MTNFHWSVGNGKLVKTSKAWSKRFGTYAKFVSFNIPRLRSETGQMTCPYAGVCADVCYAGQGRMNLPMALGSRERNLALINELGRSGFADAVLEDVGRMRSTTHIRIHDSGDFFKRWYYQAWVDIAEEIPDITVYAYTKSLPFIEWDTHPDNFRIVQSAGGKRDVEIDPDYPHAKIFPTLKERKREGYCDGNESDMPAVLGYKKIGLVYHGVRNLTDHDLIQLRGVS